MSQIPLLSPIEIIGVCIFCFVALVKIYKRGHR